MEEDSQGVSLGTRRGRRKGVAFSLQATPENQCIKCASNQSRTKGTLACVSSLSHKVSPTSPRANTEVSPPPPQKARPHSPPARVPSQVQAGALRAVSRSPLVVGEARQVLPICGASTAITSPKSTCGTLGLKCRSANEQEGQLQIKRGTKGTSKTDKMERQEQESARCKSPPLTTCYSSPAGFSRFTHYR